MRSDGEAGSLLAVNIVQEPWRALRVTIVGGGPVGPMLTLLLDHAMDASAAVTVYDALNPE